MATVIGDIGNASGYLYVTDTNGTSVLSSVKNTQDNVRRILADAGSSNPIASTGAYSTVFGRRYFLNSDSGATQGVLTSSLEITAYVVMKGLQGEFPNDSYTIASGVLTPTRKSGIIYVQTEGEGGASDTLDTIVATGFLDGDIIISYGATAAHVITFSNNTGNIKLANATNFLTGDKTHIIILRYNLGDTTWYEITRTPNPLLTVANMRSAGIPQPISGVAETTLTNGGGTINLEPGVDKGVQVYLGSPTLAASWTIQIKAVPTTPYLDGDTMIVEYRSLATVGSNTVTIFGITLTTTQALEGRVKLLATYKLSDTTWYYDIFYDAHGVDVENRAYTTATYEPKLGNPAGNGYILSSNTAGVRSWIPNPGGSNLWEVGAVAGSIQTLGNGAAANGVASIAAGENTIANDNAIAIGDTAQALGGVSISIGLSSTANNDDSIAIGDLATTNADDSIAIGFNAITNVDSTVNISGCIITKKSSIVSTLFRETSAAIITISTGEFDLKSVTDTTIIIPAGAKFYPDGVDLIITTLGGTFTGQPTVRAGITGTLDKLLAAIPTVGLSAVADRECFTVAYRGGVSTITCGVTNAATGSSTIKGRFVFSGKLIELE